jgi:hypothetical protein
VGLGDALHDCQTEADTCMVDAYALGAPTKRFAERVGTAVGVVMGQGQGSDTSALLAAAGEAAKQLVASPSPQH